MPQQVQDLKRAKQLVKELLSLTDEAIHQCQGARSWGFLDILGGSTLSTLVKHVKISSTKNVLDDINYKMRELKQCININNMPEGFTVNRGFFATLLDLAAYVLSMIGAKLFSAQLAPVVYQSVVQPPLRAKIVEGFGSAAGADIGAQVQAALQAIPDSIAGVMKLLGLSWESLVEKVSTMNLTGKHAIDKLMQSAVDPIATAVVRTALFVIIAFVLTAVLKVVFHLLNRVIKELPAIKQINTGLGVVLGVLRGVVLVFLLALGLGLVSGLVANDWLIEAVRHSYVEKWVSGFLDSISGFVAA